MNGQAHTKIVTFFHYPPLGPENWRYTYATARVRTLMAEMLELSTLADMANAASFDDAVDVLSNTDYTMAQGSRSLADLEEVLLTKRAEVRSLFEQLAVDDKLAELFKARVDMANLRLAVRRVVTDKPVGDDYSDQGNVSPDEFEEILEQENYGLFPDYLQEAVERAVLGYYENKDIKAIDFGIDQAHAEYALKTADDLESIFLEGLFRLQIDLNNLRTMLRLKFLETEERAGFIEGGFVDVDRFRHGVDVDYETIPGLFLATPYHTIIEEGVRYLQSHESFLMTEQRCDEYLRGFLEASGNITAGLQPLVAYLLLGEDEVRKVRLILTAKKNGLDKDLILDRITRR
jgi:V/A-type H+-transporting ATPase subunit C